MNDISPTKRTNNQSKKKKKKSFQIFLNLKQKIHWIMQTIAKSKPKQESQKLTKKQN